MEISFSPVEEFAEQEKLKNYQKRVSDWIGSQGILFQLRYARTTGVHSIFKQLGTLLVRLVITFALLVGVGYFLVGKYFEGENYEKKIGGQLQKAMGASEIEAKGFARSRGNGGYRNVSLEGGESSFFYGAKMTGLNAPLSYLTGLTQKWAPDSVNIDEADFSLRAGGERDEMMEGYSGVIESFQGGGITSIIVSDFSCDWGYSKLTYGRIANSRFQADLEDGKWIISLTGGTYQQNWLSDFEIESGNLIVDPSGLEVVSLSLRNRQGTLELAGSVGGPLEMPEFDLNGVFSDLEVDQFLEVEGVDVREFLEGHISGDLKITGSTNSLIKIDGNASVANERTLTIRERWTILKAISIMDTGRTFRRVDFNEGSFGFTSERGGLTIRNLDLKAKDTAKLLGEFTTRLPDQEEAAEFLEITLTKGFSSDFTDTSTAQKLEDDRMSLSDALRESRRVDDLTIDRSAFRANARDRDVELSAKELDGIRLLEEMKVHRITGKLKMAIPASSFSAHETLIQSFPDDGEGWRWIEIPLSDTTFSQISNDVNEKILDQARIRSSGEIE